MTNKRKISLTEGAEYRILVVDDKKDVRYIVSEYLKALGCRPVPAKSAEEGFAHFVKGRFDAVVADYMLDGEGGLDLLTRIRKESDVPFLIMTGYPTERIAVDALNLGADGFLYKPFTLDEFEAAVLPIIHKRQQMEEKSQAERLLRSENNRLLRRFFYFSEFDRFSKLLDKADSLEGFLQLGFAFLKKLFNSDLNAAFLLDGKNATLYLPAPPEELQDLTNRLSSAFQREMISKKIPVHRIKYANLPGAEAPAKGADIRRTLLLPLNSYSGMRGSLVLGWEKRFPIGDDAAMVLRWMAGRLADRIEMPMQLVMEQSSKMERTDTVNIMR